MAEETQSIEEKVEAIFVPEEVEEPEPVAEEVVEAEPEATEEVTEEEIDPTEDFIEVPEEALVEVEWDGQLIEAPKDIAEALMRQSDYTEKTQKVAAQRKEVEVQLGMVEQTRQQFNFVQSIQPDIQKAQQLEATAEQYHDHLRANIDSLSATDITKLQMAISDSRSERDAIINDVKNKQGEFQQAQEQSHTELLNKGTEVLRQKIPGWSEKEQKQLREYALNSGFTEAEITQLVDPRQVEALYKASQYDALKSGVIPAVKKVQSAPKIKTKARNPMPDDVKNKLNLRKKLKNPNRTDRDKVKDIREAMGERFS